MQAKQKPKIRTCCICKNKSPISEMYSPPGSMKLTCSVHSKPECATALSMQLLEKKKENAWKAKKKAHKANDTAHQHKLTQKAFNRMRVLEELKWFNDRGLEPTCISCGRPKGKDQWCCGHNKTVGSNGSLRYDRKNTYLQHNFSCNMNLSGDIAGTKSTRGYRAGVLERFGELEGNDILEYCDTNSRPRKYAGDELEGMRSKFNARIRELEQ